MPSASAPSVEARTCTRGLDWLLVGDARRTVTDLYAAGLQHDVAWRVSGVSV